MKEQQKNAIHWNLGILESSLDVFKHEISSSEILFLKDSINKVIENLRYMLENLNEGNI